MRWGPRPIVSTRKLLSPAIIAVSLTSKQDSPLGVEVERTGYGATSPLEGVSAKDGCHPQRSLAFVNRDGGPCPNPSFEPRMGFAELG